MWRSMRLFLSNSKISSKQQRFHERLYSTRKRSNGASVKVIFGTITSLGLGFTGAIVYAQYDPKFRRLLENTPYVNFIFKMLNDDGAIPIATPNDDLIQKREKAVEGSVSSNIVKKKVDNGKADIFHDLKPLMDSELKPSKKQFNDIKRADDINVKKGKSKEVEKIFESSKIKDDFASYEKSLIETLEKLKQVSEEAINAQKMAESAVRFYTEKIFEALHPDSLNSRDSDDLLWERANYAGLEREEHLRIAKQKATETKILISEAQKESKNLNDIDSGNSLVKNIESFAAKCLKELKNVETKLAAAQTESGTLIENEHFLKTNEKQLKEELAIILPNYPYEGLDKPLIKDDLYLLLSHAHHRIRQLQKELVEQQDAEKVKFREAMRNQRMEDEREGEFKIQAELQKYLLRLESVIEDRVALARTKFEAELHQQLFRQAAVHADHLQEVLKIKGQELERKLMLELEEKLLHEKGVLISDTSENVARLKEIVKYLQAKNELEKSSKKAQAVWLVSQKLNYKISQALGNLISFADEIATLKTVADKDSDFISTVISSIPPEAVNRGVVPYKILKERFENVKRVCKRVALINENNNSLYAYFLSYVQSFLIIDNVSSMIKSRELQSKVALDTSEWDTFDVLSRISYCIEIDDLEQALSFANQLKGEPRTVAKDWIKEVQLFLETQLAIKALHAYAVAVNVQAYH